MESKTELIASQLCITPKNEFTWGTSEQNLLRLKICVFPEARRKKFSSFVFWWCVIAFKGSYFFGSFTSIVWLRTAFVVFRTILRFFHFFDKIEQEASLHEQIFHEVSVQWAPNCRTYLNAAQKFLLRQYIGAHTKQLPIFVTYLNTWTLSIIATERGTSFP